MLKSQAQVKTDKAERYLKALCNHFSHKVQATYDENHGSVQFAMGSCEMDANADTLSFAVQAENAEGLEQVKDVVGGHLERFSGADALQVTWQDQA